MIHFDKETNDVVLKRDDGTVILYKRYEVQVELCQEELEKSD